MATVMPWAATTKARVRMCQLTPRNHVRPQTIQTIILEIIEYYNITLYCSIILFYLYIGISIDINLTTDND